MSFIFIFVGGFGFSCVPTAWVYCTEIFPISMRAKGTSIITAIHWIVNCTIAIIAPKLFLYIWNFFFYYDFYFIHKQKEEV
jgi:hypothetical protein